MKVTLNGADEAAFNAAMQAQLDMGLPCTRCGEPVLPDAAACPNCGRNRRQVGAGELSGARRRRAIHFKVEKAPEQQEQPG